MWLDAILPLLIMWAATILEQVSDLPDPSTQQELDQRLRDAVRRDRDVINSGQVRLPRNTPFDGRNLRWSDLGVLVSDALSVYGFPKWDPELVERAIKSRLDESRTRVDRSLPWARREREAFIRSVQEVMNRSYDMANELRGLSLGPAENYWEFLGYERTSVTYHELGFDLESLGFFRIMDWNRRRMLVEKTNVASIGAVEEVDQEHVEDWAQHQDWVDPTLLQSYLDREHSIRPGGLCPALASYIEDTREQGNDQLKLRVRRSRYYQNVAIRKLFLDEDEDNRVMYNGVLARVRSKGLSSVVAKAPLSNIALNITILSRAGRLMLIRRPANATTFGNSYQLGPHETMNWPELAGEHFENCFELARRALYEEALIENPDEYYGRIVFSYFGYFLPEAQGYFFAHVQTRFTEDQLVERVQQSPSRFESEDVIWDDPSEDLAHDVLSCWPSGPFSPTLSKDRQRIYLPHAALSIIQLLRVIKEGMLPHVPGSRLGTFA